MYHIIQKLQFVKNPYEYNLNQPPPPSYTHNVHVQYSVRASCRHQKMHFLLNIILQ